MDVSKEKEMRLPKGRAVLCPRDKLQFARWILSGIFIFWILSVSVWLLTEALGETLLEICKTGLLPIASFVIGDYFGSRGQ
jgi:hypothetical protein